MGFNFLDCDRDQRFLLPPDMREWLPEDHLAFFVIDAVDRLDLAAFYASYRADGWGRAAFHPKMMVALVLYAFAIDERSSRRIERRCVEDVAFRIITGNQRPDHSTIARFIARHQNALKEMFIQVLGLCAAAGLVRTGMLALDGTKMAANASPTNNLTRDQIKDLVDRIFEEAREINEREDRLYGDARGDELPEHLADRKTRLEWLDEQLGKRGQTSWRGKPTRINSSDPDSRTLKTMGGFVQGYNAQAAVTEDQVVVASDVTTEETDRAQLQPMVRQAIENLGEAGVDETVGTVVADAGYLSSANLDADLGVDLLIAPVSSARLADALRTPAEPTACSDPADDAAAVEREIDRRAGIISRAVNGEITMKKARDLLGLSLPHTYHLKDLFVAHGREGITPRRPAKRPPPLLREVMLERFRTEDALQTYAKRSTTIEPVFGQTKEARGFRKFARRGQAGCALEWSLMMTTHNLRRMWKTTSCSGRSLLAAARRLLLGPIPITV